MSANTNAMIKYEPTLAAADGSVEQLVARDEHKLLFSEAAKMAADNWVPLHYAGGDKKDASSA